GLPPSGVTEKLRSVNVQPFIAREKVAVGVTVTGTPVAPPSGCVFVTVGAPRPDVNAHFVTEASGTWSAVSTAVVSSAVYAVVAASGDVGVRVAVFVESSYDTVVGTGEPPAGVSVKVAGVRLLPSIERLNVAVTLPFTAAPVAPCAGDTAVGSAAAGVPSSSTTRSTK